jgi:hypothetical protein
MLSVQTPDRRPSRMRSFPRWQIPRGYRALPRGAPTLLRDLMCLCVRSHPPIQVFLLMPQVSAQPTRALGLGEPSPLVSTSAMISASLKIENHRSSAIAAFTWARVAIDTAQDIHAQGPKGTMPTVVVFVVRPGLVAFGAVGPLVETRGLGIIGGAG